MVHTEASVSCNFFTLYNNKMSQLVEGCYDCDWHLPVREQTGVLDKLLFLENHY